MSILFVDHWGSDAAVIDDNGNTAAVAPPHHEDFEATKALEEELERLGFMEDDQVALDVLSSIVKERRGHAE